MSALITARGHADDRFMALADEDALPPSGAVLVSLARWERDAADLKARGDDYAVRIPNTLDVGSVDAGLLDARMIVLDFPSFADGRGYSQARLLREARGYRGGLRASGAAVVLDQLLGMSRCGIDSFELRADQSVDACLAALREHPIAYQPALDERPRVRQLRRRGH